MKWSPELKVGIMVTIALVILMGAIFLLTNVQLMEPGYSVTATFNFLGDLRTGASVRFAGGPVVGQVTHIYPLNGKVAVQFEITDKHLKLRRDSKIEIYTAGVLGQKYVNIDPQLGHGPFLKSGEVICGEDPANMDETFVALGNFLKSIDEVLGTPQTAAHLENIFKNVDHTTQMLLTLTQTSSLKINYLLNSLIQSSSNIHTIIQNSKNISTNVNNFVQMLSKSNLNMAIENFNTTMGSLNQMMNNVNQGKGLLGVLLKDQRAANEFKSTIRDLQLHPWKLLWKN
jgi:phospholipid/cholesterol/gamma-HCH transport system substrate-binding protein